MVDFPAGYVSLLYSTQGNSGTHPTSHAMGTASSFLSIQQMQHGTDH